MIIWLFACILDLLFNAICYITNPIVVLFANEVGELPKIFYWWSNWDDCLDIEWMIYDHHVPKWAEYDYRRHYRFYDKWTAVKTTGKYTSYVEILDPDFTIKERFQRYICRLTWLYRNCAYGFSYAVTGRMIDGSEVIVKRDDYANIEKDYVAYYKNWLIDPFCIFIGKFWNVSDIPWLRWTGINKEFYFKLYIGYKFEGIKPEERMQSMLALFCWPFTHENH